MKNFIFNNYGINVKKIYVKNEESYFFVNNTKIKILLLEFDDNYVNELYRLTNTLFQKGILVDTCILNKDGKVYSMYNENKLVLSKVNNFEKFVDLESLISFNNIDNNLRSINVINEWKDEIDIIEREILEYNEEYPLIQNSINYFIGYAETAIALMNNYKSISIEFNDSIGHIVNYSLFDENSIYSINTFIKTNKMYDISNYIKYKFIKNEINYSEVDYIYKNIALNEYEKVYLFSSLMYPSVYFSLIKEIIKGKEKEEKLDYLIKIIKTYNELLLYCKTYVNKYLSIQMLNWL